MLACKDNFTTTFSSYPEMLHYHRDKEAESIWHHCKIGDLRVEPLGPESPLAHNLKAFAAGISEEAINDTVANLGLALRVDGKLYPIRGTAYKTLLDRAKINGTALPKLKRQSLANVLNDCLALHSSDALVLVRDEKVTATHSGDERDYSRLPMNELLEALEKKMDQRFPGNQFETGYTDHSITSACWTFPNQKEDLLETYSKVLRSQGKTSMAGKIVPGIRFMTSDTGVASARVSALLMGLRYPIHIGSCISVNHRLNTKVTDFEKELDLLFAQFVDSVKKLEHLTEVYLAYPVDAMARVCKKLNLPKKERDEAVAAFQDALGDDAATAHDVFLAMQEVLFILKSKRAPESKLLQVEEKLAQALSIDWDAYDVPKAVSA